MKFQLFRSGIFKEALIYLSIDAHNTDNDLFQVQYSTSGTGLTEYNTVGLQDFDNDIRIEVLFTIVLFSRSVVQNYDFYC